MAKQSIEGWEPDKQDIAKDEPIVLNAQLFWAGGMSTQSDEGKFTVDVGQLSDKAVEKLQSTSRGISVKNKDDEDDYNRGNYISCSSSREIYAFDTDGNRIDANTIGNGTKAIVTGVPYDWEYKKKQGTSPSIRRITVTELVLREDGGDIDWEALPEAI